MNEIEQTSLRDKRSKGMGKRVLITGARAPVTLDLARHFSSGGWSVYLTDSLHLPIARLSRQHVKYIRTPAPAVHYHDYCQAIHEAVARFSIDLVLPTCEEVFYLANDHLHLSSLTRLFAMPLADLEPLHNKWTFSQTAAALRHAITSPPTRLFEEQTDVMSWARQNQLSQFILKPVYSRFAARTILDPSLPKLHDLNITPHDPWVAQQRIRGQERSTYSVAIDGQVTAHVCYHSPYRAGLGSGIYFIALDDPVIADFVQCIVKQTQFTGQIAFDFIRQDDGRTFVLECNPRATSGIHLFPSGGLVDAFSDSESLVTVTSSRPAMLGAIMMLYGVWPQFRRGEWSTLVRDLWQARDVMFSTRDPLPFCLSPLTLIEIAARSVRTRKPLTEAATFDIEWNGERMA